MFCKLFPRCSFFTCMVLGTVLKSLKGASSPPSLSVSRFPHLPELRCWVQVVAGHCAAPTVTASWRPGWLYHKAGGLCGATSAGQKAEIVSCRCLFLGVICSELWEEVWLGLSCMWIWMDQVEMLGFFYIFKQGFFKSLFARRMWWCE